MENENLKPSWSPDDSLASELIRVLRTANDPRFVLAESCSCGLASAIVGSIAGISQWYCGSMVTYRPATKLAWLKVDETSLSENSPESIETSGDLAVQVLSLTEEADWSAAITGHLGPDAGPTDGQVYIAVARRNHSDRDSISLIAEDSIALRTQSRQDRQFESAHSLIQRLTEAIADRMLR